MKTASGSLRKTVKKAKFRSLLNAIVKTQLKGVSRLPKDLCSENAGFRPKSELLKYIVNMGLDAQLSEEYSSKLTEYYQQPRNELLDYINEDVKFVLDVGCAGGTFGKLLKTERNCVVWGIEPSEAMAKEAAQHLDKVINDTFSENLSELDGKLFDVICFNDVLEHMVNPNAALKVAQRFLSKNGYIVASIPNVLYFPVISQLVFQQDWKYAEYGVLDNTHLRFYTKKSMVRMFEDCGFEVSRIEGINPLVTKKYFLANLLLLNFLYDWRFIQFVVIATPKTT